MVISAMVVKAQGGIEVKGEVIVGTLCRRGQVDAEILQLVSDINSIWSLGTGDKGYGETELSLTLDDCITESDWGELHNAVATMDTHQAITLSPALADLSTVQGPLPVPYDEFKTTLQSNIAQLIPNRLIDDPINHAVEAKLSSVRNTSWGVQLVHDFTVTFTDTDHARHYFNTGGEIRVSASRTGGSVSAQNTAWTDLVDANSAFIFDHIGYFALTGSFITIATFTSGGSYGLNNWSIKAKRDDAAGPRGAAGSIVHFQSIFTDGHTGPSDTVDGTFTSFIDNFRSVVAIPIASPTYLTVTELTAGS